MGVPFLFRGIFSKYHFWEILQIRMGVDGYENFIILV
jgi:hypothetical protein